jgi:hypothetical protein
MVLPSLKSSECSIAHDEREMAGKRKQARRAIGASS